MGLEISSLVQYGTLAGVGVALWQAFYTRAKDRDEQTSWRTEADIKLDSIDLGWKPQVNTRLDALDERMLNLDKQLVEQNKTVIKELRAVNAGISQLDKTVALAIQARENLQKRVEQIESR